MILLGYDGCKLLCIINWLVASALLKILVSWDDYSQYMEI